MWKHQPDGTRIWTLLTYFVTGLSLVSCESVQGQPSLTPGAPTKGVPTAVRNELPANPVTNGNGADPNSTNGNGTNGHGTKYTIGACIQIALEKQPKLSAVRSSILSAQAGARGLEDTRFIGSLLIRDLPYRRQQAAKGILAANAELSQAELEVIQAVVWNYYTIIYAREQLKAVKELVEVIQTYRDQVDKIVNSKEGGNKDINQNTLDTLTAALAKANRKKLDAESGIKRAQAALREAMGVTQDCEFDLADNQLPTIDAVINKSQVAEFAVCRRGEVILATIASEVGRLEVFAQWAVKFRIRTHTYASASDIHHQLIPGGSRDGEYRPDALAPEMPIQFIGSRSNRAAKAQALSDRAASVLEKTKNLVLLEAENSYLEWETASEKAREAKKEVDATRDLLKRVKQVAGDEGFKGETIEKVIRIQAAYTEALADYNQARYQQITTLAALERITGGGLKVNYPGR